MGVEGKRADTEHGLDASDKRQPLRFRRPFTLPGVPWLLGWGQRLVTRFDGHVARIRNFSTARPALDVLAGFRWRLPWFLTWCHIYHLPSMQVDFDIMVELRSAEYSISVLAYQGYLGYVGVKGPTFSNLGERMRFLRKHQDSIGGSEIPRCSVSNQIVETP